MEIKELGHVVLYVSDLLKSRNFYKNILGWREIGNNGPRVGTAMFTTGRTHHELLLIEVGNEATGIPTGRRLGMYHFGLKIGTSDDELVAAIAELEAAGVAIVGLSDHTVTHSIYILDPDGNEIELYIDVQPETWRKDPSAVLVPTKPLNI
ncbi:MAG: glyoxalase [Chloroflexi bacterium]|nr:glyoxalase [Chloroflexota bacterium]MQF86678.1 VOC family protein [SAR202 cluster bacterium]|tara:strand:- start:21 stop:473 length:453 start_codon:yes stop_codon:yes gene_type:complete